MRYIVFVDFDGVLTSQRVHMAQPNDSYPLWSTFDPIAIEWFNKIDRTYHDVSFVWTTTWRNNLIDSGHIRHIVYSMWYNAGFRGNLGDPWRVNPDNSLPTDLRAEEIADYLTNWAPECEDYLILDDSNYNFNKILPKKRFVQTSPTDGILSKHMLDALSIMGKWEKR